ncbi:MAG: coenzyme F420-0:L-glutamate ligase [Patescibacteria group bacterium]
MNIKAFRTKIFREKDNLISFITSKIKKIPENSILVVTSKIVALSEGRVVLASNEKSRERIIRSESQFAMKTKYTWLTIKDGMVLASAGVDESNADGKIILLPKDSFRTALRLRTILKKHYKVRNLGIIISDSRLLPLRAGVVGIALGYAGFKGIRTYVGTPDLFGRPLTMSRTDSADSLATAAVMVMGEGAERQPLALVTGAPVEFKDRINKKELAIDIKEDLYQPLFEKIKKIKYKK